MNYEWLHLRPARPNGAPPVLFIHGAFHAAWCWERWMGAFSERGFDCYAFSLRGHGASEGEFKGASLSDYLDDLRAVLPRLPASPIVVGHSLGAYLLQHLTATEDFPAAVLVASVPHRGMPLGATLRGMAKRPLRIARALLGGDMSPMIEGPHTVRELYLSAAIPEEELVAIHAKLGGESARAFVELGPFGKKPARGKRKTPMLVLAPELDPTFTPGHLAATANEFGAEFALVPGSGHDVMLDVSWRLAADLTCNWLEKKSSSAVTPLLDAASAPA